MALQPTDQRQDIVYQCCIAFGQGTGGMRVPRETCRALADYCLAHLEVEHRVQNWGEPENGTQALERVRVIGRIAANEALAEGCTCIWPEHFKAATGLMEGATEAQGPRSRELTNWCDETPTETGST